MNAMYMARAFDRYYTASSSSSSSSTDDIETEKELFRIGVSVSKYFVTKRLPGFVYECMEALGGNGYVEDFPMARLFRQSPLNAIWEGSGNVIALDILRGHAALPILLKDIQQVRGSDSRLDAYVAQVEATVNAVRKDPLSLESQRGARNLVDRLALALQASILVRYGDKQVKKRTEVTLIIIHALICSQNVFFFISLRLRRPSLLRAFPARRDPQPEAPTLVVTPSTTKLLLTVSSPETCLSLKYKYRLVTASM